MKRAVSKLVKTLKNNNLTIAFAESVTCGLASHQLSTIKGTSEIFKGSIVSYDEQVKINLLGVAKSLIKKYTAESQQVTDAMVKKLPRLFKADVYAAITGLAADGGSESKNKPVGTVFLSVLYKDKIYRDRKLFRGSPLEIKKKSCDELYAFIYRILIRNHINSKSGLNSPS